MHIIVNPQQMRALEARAFSLGVPSLLLMEDAFTAPTFSGLFCLWV